jgi:ParB-like chromosome segregation protein Spo0J
MKKSGSSELTVKYLPIESLIAYSNNARTHSRHQIRQIAESIRTFGFTTPVLIDDNNTIIAGHGRAQAAKLLGMRLVPAIRLESMTQEQIRAYVIADNRLAEKAGWDKSILAIELQHLLTIDGDLDVTITGFEIPEIDLILEEASGKQRDEDDVFNVDETSQAVTQRGDL